MLFAAHCLDNPDCESIRAENHAAHRDHLGRTTLKILVAGPLTLPDGETSVGSLYIAEAASRAEVDSFISNDPFRVAGVWGDVKIHAFSMRVDRRQSAGP